MTLQLVLSGLLTAAGFVITMPSKSSRLTPAIPHPGDVDLDLGDQLGLQTNGR